MHVCLICAIKFYLLTYCESRWDGCGACGRTDCVLWLAGTWVESWCMIGRKRRSTCSSARPGCLRVTCMAHWTRPSLRRLTPRRSASTTSSPSTRSGRHTVLTWRHVTWPQNQSYTMHWRSSLPACPIANAHGQCRINANRGPWQLFARAPLHARQRPITGSQSSRYDMLAIISSRYQYGPFLFFCCRSYVKLLDHWRAEKNVSTSGGPLRPKARGICHICHMVNPALHMGEVNKS